MVVAPRIRRFHWRRWLAASFKSQQEVEETYRRLLANPQQLLDSTATYYSKYLAQTVSLKLPDPQLQRAIEILRASTALRVRLRRGQ